jgi:hypothetical protein
MRQQPLFVAVLVALGASACDQPVQPLAPSLSGQPIGDGSILVTGGGEFTHPTLGTVTVSLSGVQDASGKATGRFQQHWGFADITFKGDVVCLAVDLVNRRVWIGGVLTHSNDPDPNPDFQPGGHAWFRGLDLPTGSGEPDRVTFLGFRGSLGIETSPEYCERQLWAANNANTWPVTGNLTIH